MTTLTIPHHFHPRPYQADFLSAMQSGCRRAVLCWHRRSGKDLTAWNFMISAALQRPGLYAYVFLEYAHAKRVIWSGQDKACRRFLDYVPKRVVISRHETELRLTLAVPSGGQSTIQLWGGENAGNGDGLGLTPTNPRRNDGWAAFVSTPRGQNHFHRLYTLAAADPKWFVSKLTVDDTISDGVPAVSPDNIEDERRAGMDAELVTQEFYCSFSGALSGAYYAHELNAMRDQGRIRSVP